MPILATSGTSSGLTRESCLALGCEDFIAKPFALPELDRPLTNILSVERRKAIRQHRHESGVQWVEPKFVGCRPSENRLVACVGLGSQQNLHIVFDL